MSVYEKEIEGADYAIVFMGKGYGLIRFDDDRTDDKGDPWWKGAYGNAHIYLKNGATDAIYLMKDQPIPIFSKMDDMKRYVEQTAIRVIKNEKSD